jgi:hypothetical protein
VLQVSSSMHSRQCNRGTRYAFHKFGAVLFFFTFLYTSHSHLTDRTLGTSCRTIARIGARVRYTEHWELTKLNQL